MRLICLSCLLVATTSACELKVQPGESATASTGDATEGSTAATAETQPTGTTALSTESPASEGGVTETGSEEPPLPPPVEPTPCEGEAIPLSVSTLALVVIPDEPECAVQTTSCWEGPEEGTVEVHLAGQAHACSEAEQVLDCGQWEVKVWIPPAHQSPGLYHLTGPELRGVESVLDPDEGDGTCDWNAAEFSATLEIVSIDATGVTGRLCHVDSPQLAAIGVDLAGSFSVPICQ